MIESLGAISQNIILDMSYSEAAQAQTCTIGGVAGSQTYINAKK